MRFMMFMYPGITDEEWDPSGEAVEAMGRYSQELRKAGMLLALDGLRPPSDGASVVFEGRDARIVDGPFTEAKELVGGFWILDVASREEAVAWARRAPLGGGSTLQVRRVSEASDFEDVAPPEVLAAEEALRARVAERGTGG